MLSQALQQEHEALRERLREATQTGTLLEHARTEEEVMDPAAVLVGQVVRQRMGDHAPVAA